MRLLFLGDVVGRSGRAAVIERLPGLRAAWGLDFVVVNGENATAGAGLSAEHAKGLLSAWTAAGGRFIDVKGQLEAGESRTFLSSPALSADDKGRLEGEVFLRAEKPLAAIVGLAGAQQGGALDRAAAARAAAATPQGGTGAEGQAVDLVLNFKGGRTYLGPFALAPAPQLF